MCQRSEMAGHLWEIVGRALTKVNFHELLPTNQTQKAGPNKNNLQLSEEGSKLTVT